MRVRICTIPLEFSLATNNAIFANEKTSLLKPLIRLCLFCLSNIQTHNLNSNSCTESKGIHKYFSLVYIGQLSIAIIKFF